MKLSPQELGYKKARDQLNYISNRIKGAYSFGHIKTFRALLHAYGMSDKDIAAANFYPSELDREVNFQDIKEYLSDRKIELETSIWLEKNPPKLNHWDVTLAPASTLDLVFKEPTEPPEPIYELEHCEKEKCSFYWYQKKGIAETLYAIDIKQHRARQIIAATGTGKTFIAGGILARRIQSKWHEGKTFTPWPYLYVTKASIVEQTKRVLTNFFGINCDEDSPECEVLVLNIEQLRSEFGKRFVREELIVEDGLENVKYIWRRNVYPIFIIWDECHQLKNVGSQQSRIAQSYNELDGPTFQLFMSATPGVRVTDFKCFAVATRVPYTFGLQKNAPLTNDHWNDFAKNIASDYGRLDLTALDYSPGAIDRLMSYMADYITRVKGIKPQFRSTYTINTIGFRTELGRKHYETAIERFMRAKAKAESDETMSAGERNVHILTALLILQIAAESNPDRLYHIAQAMVDCVEHHKQAALAAMKFKISIGQLTHILVNEFGVPRDKISIIWGGKPQQNKKSVAKDKLQKNKKLMEMMAAEGISMKDLNLEDIEAQEELSFDPALRLGTQSREQRQVEVDKFQRGETLYCIYSFKAGGVGLSLHHTDEMVQPKVRHKPSGFAVEEDIPNIPTRQRVCFIGPTWSPFDAVQAGGRPHRINSLSNTSLIFIFMPMTIENRIKGVLSLKLGCLSRAVRNHEDWSDLALGKKSIEDYKDGDSVTEEEETGLLSDNVNGEDEE